MRGLWKHDLVVVAAVGVLVVGTDRGWFDREEEAVAEVPAAAVVSEAPESAALPRRAFDSARPPVAMEERCRAVGRQLLAWSTPQGWAYNCVRANGERIGRR